MPQAKYFGEKRNNNQPRWLVLHHSWTDGPVKAADAARAFDRYHTQEKGWDAIGYHFVIGVDGSLALGRHPGTNGAHAKGFNTRSLGLCLVGNLDQRVPPHEQMSTLGDLVRRLMGEHDIPASHVIGHRETYLLNRGLTLDQIDSLSPAELLSRGAGKSCPGWNFNLMRFRNRLASDPGNEALDIVEAEATLAGRDEPSIPPRAMPAEASHPPRMTAEPPEWWV